MKKPGQPLTALVHFSSGIGIVALPEPPPMPSQLTVDDLAVTWANRALISSAAIFIYDFALTFTNEIELYRHSGRDHKLLWSFFALRYFPALYQFLMLFAVIFDNETVQRCN
ncbi:hypothetical protein C8R47DRAFT_571937 [Mycena vitilis]|nr:hypothetical protein C8R47DRAFT_571937 [Mycena vitilis]